MWLYGGQNTVDLKTCSVLYKRLLFGYGGPGSSVGIATELRAGRSGDRIPVGARFSSPIQTVPGAHPASCTMSTGSFPGVKSGRSVTLTTHPLLVSLSRKIRAISLPTLWATTGPVTGTLYLLLIQERELTKKTQSPSPNLLSSFPDLRIFYTL